MKKQNKWSILSDYIFTTLGVAIMGFAINFFLAPNTIAPGGVSGLSILVKKVFGISPAMTILAINVPLFTVGILLLGKSFGAKTGYATLALTFFIEFFGKAITFVPPKDLILCAVYGGILMGTGIGLVFKSGGTTGGTDLAGAIINKFVPQLSIPKLMMCVDATVTIMSGIVNKSVETTLYSAMALYIIVKVADFILEGMGYAKAFMVFSDKNHEIADSIMENLNRGATILNGRGMYTGNDKDVLLVVVPRVQEVALKNIVRDIDDGAFVMVVGIHEVLGRGFKPMASA